MKNYLTEGLGVFFLVLLAALAGGDHGALALGAALVAITYAGQHLSGAHFNPALSLSMLMRGHLSREAFPAYAIAQVAGAIVGGLLGGYLLGATPAHSAHLHTNDDVFAALLSEFLGTMALTWVFLNTTTLRSTQGNPYFGLAIGFTFLASLLTLGEVSGGAFNPALAIGYAIVGHLAWGDLWLYLIGNLLGAAAAVTVFAVVHEEK